MAASTRVGAVYNTGQGCFVLDERDQFVCKQLIETGFYGQDEISILKTLCTSSTRMLLLGAHVGTMPPSTLRALFNHPLTEKGLKAFLDDWAKTGQSII